jgi:membrane protein
VPARAFLPRLAERSVAEFLDDHCAQYASSIAYHVLFSIFPLAIALTAIFGIVVRTTGSRANIVDTLVRNVPLSASGDAQLRSLLDGATGNASTLGLVGIAGVLYGASGMMASIRLALNDAWDVVDYRPYLRGKLLDIALVLLAAALALTSLGATVAIRALGISWILGVVVPLVASFGTVLFLYRAVPAADVSVADAWPAALFVSCTYVLTENLFAFYVDHFTHYNAVYGSLGAVIAFMFFVYLSALVFLFGAEVASEWPHVRRTIEKGDAERRPPLRSQLGDAFKGLWVRRD